MSDPLLASVVISTYNRADALEPTLTALARQDRPPSEYEVIVVDDGSTDTTPDVLASLSMPYRLRIFRQPVNSGVSAGRNVGLRAAEGELVIMLSDDLIVPANFISEHIATHERFSNSWVVGGFAQMDSLTDTPFGRFLDALEQSFEEGRTRTRIDDTVYEMTVPTARNLSVPRTDLERIGLFDEQFRVTCEDQDLAIRAEPFRVRYLYNAALECIHNDQAATLERYCGFQERGARDGVRLFAKYPDVYGGGPLERVNGPIRRGDGPRLIVAKLIKRVLAIPIATAAMTAAVHLGERARLPDRVLAAGYRALIGVHTFRGWRTGLREQRSV
jgi:GT2 family glycosyltransferase